MSVTMRESWTDERLDDFRGEVNRRFDEAERRTDARFDDVDRRFNDVDRRLDGVDKRLDKLDSRFDDLIRVIMVTGGGAIITMLGVIVTAIAT